MTTITSSELALPILRAKTLKQTVRHCNIHDRHMTDLHKALIKELHRFFYFHQYDEQRYPTFRCADMMSDYCMDTGDRVEYVVFYS